MAAYLVQLEENLMFRVTRLEQRLEAFRKLHADELDEIARGLAELRLEVEALRMTCASSPTPPTSVEVKPPIASDSEAHSGSIG